MSPAPIFDQGKGPCTHLPPILSIPVQETVLTFYLRSCWLTWKWCWLERRALRFVLVWTCERRGGYLHADPHGGVRVCVSLQVLIKDGQASATSPLAIAAMWMPNTTDRTHFCRARRLLCSSPQINLTSLHTCSIPVCLFLLCVYLHFLLQPSCSDQRWAPAFPCSRQ